MGEIGIILGLVIASMFFIMIGYLIFMNDPLIVTIIDTKNPKTEMSVTDHSKTGVLEYWYHIIDDISNIQIP